VCMCVCVCVPASIMYTSVVHTNGYLPTLNTIFRLNAASVYGETHTVGCWSVYRTPHAASDNDGMPYIGVWYSIIGV
jgi:hypothetical protein